MLRVFARLFDDDADITRPATKQLFTRRVMEEMPKETPGPYNEALMELGALVCVPGTPQCEVCPLREICLGYASGRAASLPVKPPKKEKKKVPVTVALIESPAGLLLQRRPAKGLLANLWQPLCFEGQSLTREELNAELAKLGVAVTWAKPWTRPGMCSPTASGSCPAGGAPPKPALCPKAWPGAAPTMQREISPCQALSRPTCPERGTVNFSQDFRPVGW